MSFQIIKNALEKHTTAQSINHLSQNIYNNLTSGAHPRSFTAAMTAAIIASVAKDIGMPGYNDIGSILKNMGAEHYRCAEIIDWYHGKTDFNIDDLVNRLHDSYTVQQDDFTKYNKEYMIIKDAFRSIITNLKQTPITTQDQEVTVNKIVDDVYKLIRSTPSPNNRILNTPTVSTLLPTLLFTSTNYYKSPKNNKYYSITLYLNTVDGITWIPSNNIYSNATSFEIRAKSWEWNDTKWQEYHNGWGHPTYSGSSYGFVWTQDNKDKEYSSNSGRGFSVPVGKSTTTILLQINNCKASITLNIIPPPSPPPSPPPNNRILNTPIVSTQSPNNRILNTPTPITDVIFSNVTTTGFTVTWTGGVGATSYTYTINGTLTTPTFDNGLTRNTATFTGIVRDQTYTLIINAINLSGTISGSSSVTLNKCPKDYVYYNSPNPDTQNTHDQYGTYYINPISGSNILPDPDKTSGCVGWSVIVINPKYNVSATTTIKSHRSVEGAPGFVGRGSPISPHAFTFTDADAVKKVEAWHSSESMDYCILNPSTSIEVIKQQVTNQLNNLPTTATKKELLDSLQEITENQLVSTTIECPDHLTAEFNNNSKIYPELVGNTLPIAIATTTTNSSTGNQVVDISQVQTGILLVVPALIEGTTIEIGGIKLLRGTGERRKQLSIDNGTNWFSIGTPIIVGNKLLVLSGLGSPVVLTVENYNPNTFNNPLTVLDYLFYFCYPVSFIGATFYGIVSIINVDPATIIANKNVSIAINIYIGLCAFMSVFIWFNYQNPILGHNIYNQKSSKTVL